ncbi:MAG: LPXTG cell wall anchor domain-containing protein [Ruminococcus sp.]|nr:LPXTG cell wall anchor domain-containing protein [Ruminococcus sp.]
MFKKIMSVMLAVIMLMSIAMIATSAAQVEIADNSADAIAEVAADAIAEVAADGAADTGADAGAETGAGNVLNFDANSTGWKNFKKIFCYIWAYGGDSFFAWQAKASACTDTDGDGVWTYDLDAKGVSLEAGVLYAVIFSNENQMQTYDLLFDTSVIGDTAYCDGTEYENPKDSTKTGQAAFWKGQDSAKYGPVKCITSIGNVVGTCIPSTTSPQAMYESFLKETLDNARTHSGKDDQTLLDDTAKALDLKQENVSEAIKATGVSVDWSADKSSLEKGMNDEATKPVDGGNGGNGGSGSQGGSGSEGGTTGTTGGSGSTGGSGGSTKTGSGSTTKTGQETTVLFIMLGVMIAAAGVIAISRKRDRA